MRFTVMNNASVPREHPPKGDDGQNMCLTICASQNENP